MGCITSVKLVANPHCIGVLLKPLRERVSTKSEKNNMLLMLVFWNVQRKNQHFLTVIIRNIFLVIITFETNLDVNWKSTIMRYTEWRIIHTYWYVLRYNEQNYVSRYGSPCNTLKTSHMATKLWVWQNMRRRPVFAKNMFLKIISIFWNKRVWSMFQNNHFIDAICKNML